MTQETKQKIQKIAQTYGYDAQSRQCIEEMAELTQAINKLWRINGKDYKSAVRYTEVKDNLLEEIADVQIMIWQMQYLLNVDVSPIIQNKLDRQMERIERE